MTISSTANRWEAIGNDSTTAFAYGNRIFAASDLKVYLDGVLQSAGYTVSGVGEAGGGNVTFAVAPTTGVSVVIVRRVPNTQPTAQQRGGAFPAASVEQADDRNTIQVQQVADDLSRSVRLTDSDVSGFTPTLPADAPAANQLLGANAGADGFVWVTAADIDLATVSGFAATLLDDEDAEAVLTTLGVTAFAQTILDDANAAAVRSTIGAEAADADILKADTADTLEAGFDHTPDALGTITSGTVTPAFADGNVVTYTNGGGHTLAPPASGNGTLVMQVTNNASAGAVTTSGFTQVTGDTVSTTDGDDFFFYITKIGSFSLLHVVALQ